MPHGGWLDGCLGVLAAVEVLRGHEGETPAVTLKLVDWADEEGARFGRSACFGSSAGGGTSMPGRGATTSRTTRASRSRTRLKENGVDLDTMGEAELPEIAAYLELHIEQGRGWRRPGKPAGGGDRAASASSATRSSLTGQGQPRRLDRR